MSGIKVFSGSAHPQLARSICEHLGVPLGCARIIRFSNENIKVCIDENVREADVFLIQPSCPPVNDGLVELLIFIDALRYASARRITAVLPYFPYIRSDKKDEPRISITARLCADLLQTAGADRVLTLDLHAPQAQGFFRIPCDQLSAVPLLCQHLRSGDLSNTVVVAADVGEAKDAGRFAKHLGLPLAIVDKRRDGDDERARAVTLVGEVAGRRCLVVDDEVATGGTLFEAAEILRSHGAQEVTAAVVHPVLCGSAVARLDRSAVSRLLVTDSIPLPPEKRSPRIEVLSVAALLAAAIARIHEGRSVSELLG
ncbi:MAG: ribose-phosphate pyrophosphokinase [Myxococcales bacterium]|nr:ribose-phosphate pyrophosphokinase [Myxococcota bacterium]MDW8280847.1 ribose-phosphate pyrophosphokinase [Myxococcales bacterium]